MWPAPSAATAGSQSSPPQYPSSTGPLSTGAAPAARTGTKTAKRRTTTGSTSQHQRRIRLPARATTSTQPQEHLIVGAQPGHPQARKRPAYSRSEAATAQGTFPGRPGQHPGGLPPTGCALPKAAPAAPAPNSQAIPDAPETRPPRGPELSCPSRRAPRGAVRQRRLAAVTGACLLAAVTASFLCLGYRALRAAETPRAWQIRRRARAACRAARAAQVAAVRDAAERDHLIDSYLAQVTPLIPKTSPAQQLD